MKLHIKYQCLAFLPAVFLFQLAQASQPPASSTSTAALRSNCNERSAANASKSLRVTVASCLDGKYIVVERKQNNIPSITKSKIFSIPVTGTGDARAIDNNTFDVYYLQSMSYSHPSPITYKFRFSNNKWVLSSMSVQYTQDCNGENAVESYKCSINYLTGKIEEKNYVDCGNHYKIKRSTVKPVTISLKNFNAPLP